MLKGIHYCLALLVGIVAHGQSYQWVTGPNNDYQIFFNCDSVRYDPMTLEIGGQDYTYEYWSGVTILGDIYSVMVSDVTAEELAYRTPMQFLAQEAEAMCNDFDRPVNEGLEETSVEGNPALLGYAANPDNLAYMVYKLVLANNKLYEVRMDCILYYPEEAEISNFIGTLTFEVDPDREAPEFVESEYDWEWLNALLAEDPEAGETVSYGTFSVAFPKTPTVDSQMLESATGPLELVTYICEQGSDLAFMVATSDYGIGKVEYELAQTLLQAGKTSALENLMISKTDIERELSKNGHPGLYFKGHNAENYVVYEMYLINGVLYQVSILRLGAYPDSAVTDSFFSSFQLN